MEDPLLDSVGGAGLSRMSRVHAFPRLFSPPFAGRESSLTRVNRSLTFPSPPSIAISSLVFLSFVGTRTQRRMTWNAPFASRRWI